MGVIGGLTPCSLILSVSHLSSLRYSRRDASAARSITKANGVPFSSMERDCDRDPSGTVTQSAMQYAFQAFLGERFLTSNLQTHR